MADFCTLCGYADINVEKIYEQHIRPVFSLEMAESLSDSEMFSCGVGGVCEHCGLLHVGVDNNFNLRGIFFDKPSQIIGRIDRETFNLTML